MYIPRRVVSFFIWVASFVCIIYSIVIINLYSSENLLPNSNNFAEKPRPRQNFLSEKKPSLDFSLENIDTSTQKAVTEVPLTKEIPEKTSQCTQNGNFSILSVSF